ncbi:TPA: hypothetical protein R4229_004301 [Morganella morganii]|nr:hypothetical protein [Morganella morganii]
MTSKQETGEEIILRMGLKTLRQSLKTTIFLINFGALKNMQAVFNEAFDEITKAKDGWYWRKITDCLNEHTGSELSVLTVKTMYKRAKKKRENESKE